MHTHARYASMPTSARADALITSARRLAQAGYQPLLEASPAGRGGHLWVIYTHQVDGYATLAHVRAKAPDLATVAEWWPRPGLRPSGNKVRLPAGRYLAPDLRRWCKLYDIHGAELSQDGCSAVLVLLSMQTPAELVPALNAHEWAALQQELSPQLLVPGDSAPMAQPHQPEKLHIPGRAGLDAHWQATYGKSPASQHLWFAITPEHLIDRFNARHQVRDLLPLEPNGYGLARWRDERTTSVRLFVRENAWIDYGAGARRASHGSLEGRDPARVGA